MQSSDPSKSSTTSVLPHGTHKPTPEQIEPVLLAAVSAAAVAALDTVIVAAKAEHAKHTATVRVTKVLPVRKVLCPGRFCRYLVLHCFAAVALFIAASCWSLYTNPSLRRDRFYKEILPACT